MVFFKKYPVLSVFFVIALLLFLGSLVFFFLQSSQYSEVSKALKKVERRYQSLAAAYPSPVSENVESTEQNVFDLQKTLLIKKNTLVSRQDILSNEPNISGIGVLGRIQGFILDFVQSAQYENADGDPKTIGLPAEEAFGFALFGGSDTVAPPDEFAPKLNLQLNVLRYLLEQLYAAEPLRLESVERERVVPVQEEKDGARRLGRDNDTAKSSANDIFTMDPAVTAAVPGSIDTIGFKLVFTGYTQSLQAFLTRIAEFEIPVVVREILVEPAKAISSVATAGKTAGGKQNPDDIFASLFGDTAPKTEPSNETIAPQRSQEPVVENNQSTFTVIVEYIDVLTAIEQNEGEEE